MSDPNPEYYNQQTVVAYGDLGAGSLFIIFDPTRSAGDRDVNVLVSSLASALNAAYLKITQNLADLDDVPTARTNLGLGGLAILDPANLESGGSDELEIALSQIPEITANGGSIVSAADYAAMRTLLSLVPGTDIQAQDALLQTIADAASLEAAGLITTGATAQTKSGNFTIPVLILSTNDAIKRSTDNDQLNIFSSVTAFQGAYFIMTARDKASTGGQFVMTYGSFVGAAPTSSKFQLRHASAGTISDILVANNALEIRLIRNTKIGADSSPSQACDVLGNIVSSGWQRTTGTTVALLDPSAPDGARDFATNGRKAGEGAGVGTGVAVVRDGGVWYSDIYNGVAVSA